MGLSKSFCTEGYDSLVHVLFFCLALMFLLNRQRNAALLGCLACWPVLNFFDFLRKVWLYEADFID
jgi:hypothetical protein